MTDPEAVADEAEELPGSTPLEAEPADVLEQKVAIDEDLEDYREDEYDF